MNEILILKTLDAKEITKLKRGIEVPTNLQRLGGPYERWPLNSPEIPLNRWACAHRSLLLIGTEESKRLAASIAELIWPQNSQVLNYIALVIWRAAA
jgi:hypothetical protein